jgi:peptidyl-tRNA hydrolase
MLSLGLETNKVWRLKIGIRPEKNKQRSETFVLKKTSENEKNEYQKLSQKLKDNQNLFLQRDLNKLQTKFNTITAL